MTEPFPIQTKRLILRRFRCSDREAFTAYRNDPRVARYQSWDSYDLDQADRFLLEQLTLNFGATDTWQQIACENRQTHQLVGDCALHFFADGKTVEIGFTLATEQQGQGFARESVGALVQLLKDRSYQRVEATTDGRNTSSIKLLKSLGFKARDATSTRTVFKGEVCEEITFILSLN